MCIKDMIKDMSCYELERSVTARMGISKNGEPIKTVSMHRSCSTPLWEVALIFLGANVTVSAICHLCKRSKCEDSEE